MPRQRAVADTHFGYFRKRGLKGRHKLCFQLAVQRVAPVIFRYVAAHVAVKHKGVDELIRIFAMAAYCDIDIEPDIFIYHTERHGVGRSVFVADDLFFIEEVNPLVFSSVAAERKTFAERFERIHKAFAETAVKQRGLRACVVNKFARLVGKFNDFSLVDDHHELAFVNGHDGTVCNNIVRSFCVRASSAVDSFRAFACEHIRTE